MIAFAIIAILCAIVIATSMLWPGSSADEQILPWLCKVVAYAVLVLDALVWVIVLAARR